MSFENAEYLLSEDKENNGRILTQMMRKTNDKSIYKQIYTKLLVENYPENLIVEAVASARYVNEEQGKSCTMQETEAIVRYILKILSNKDAKEAFKKKFLEEN